MPAFQIGLLHVRLEKGSITELGTHVDALVSSDDNYLTHGGGVSRALWEAAGAELQSHVEAEAPKLRLGDVYATPAFGLDAKLLLHAIIIDFDANLAVGPAEISGVFGAVFDTASRLECHELATPLLGAGTARLDVGSAAVGFAEAIEDRAALVQNLTSVVLVTTPDSHGIALDVLKKRLTERPPVGEQVERLSTVLGDRAAGLQDSWNRLKASDNAGALAWALFLERSIDAVLAWALQRATDAAKGGRVALPEGVFTDTDGRVRLVEEATLSASRRFELLKALLESLGDPLTESTTRVFRDAWAARNSLAHGLSENQDADKTMLRAAELLLLHTNRDRSTWGSRGAATIAAAAGELLGAVIGGPVVAQAVAGIAGALGRAMPGNRPEGSHGDGGERRSTATGSEATTGACGRRETGPGTAHVIKLRDFLKDNLHEETLARLYARLTNEGYRGAPEMCLLEFCVRMEDPVNFVASEFSARELRKFVEKETGGLPHGDNNDRELASQLLESFGYPRARRPYGLGSVHRHLTNARRDIHMATVRELKGAVTEASSQLEYLLQILLRFLCQAAFRQSPEAYFWKTKFLEKSQVIDRLSLGRLVELLQYLGKELASDDSDAARLFRTDPATKSLVPKDAQRLAELRNSFAHFDRVQQSMTIEEARKAAAEFFDKAIEFVEYVGLPETRVFPHVIRIQKIQIDEWGRRLIEARTDDDMIERIFTDRVLEPGQVYFMHPTTNPLRVEPVLVPAGDTDDTARKQKRQ